MADETYEGWTNRETWALNLWLTNDQGLYDMIRERVADAMASAVEYHEDRTLDAHYLAFACGAAVKEAWEELTDPDEGLMSAENILKMVRDVGSDYRIDWDEIGRHWLEDVTEDRPHQFESADGSCTDECVATHPDHRDSRGES